MRSVKNLFLIVSLVAVFAFSGAFLDKWLSNAEAKREVYPDLKTFTEILSLIDKNYVEEPDNKELVQGAIRGMLQTLDPHSSYMTPDQFSEMQVDTSGKFGGLGIQIGMKDGMLTVIAPIEGTPAEKAGIKAGDKIVKVEGESTKGINLHEAVSKLRGPKGSKVTITTFRESDKEFRDVTIIRDIIKVKSVKQKVLEESVGYVKINQFQERTADDLSKALKALADQNIDSLVLDLRNNPGGLLNSAIDVADQFFPPNKLIVYTKDRSGQRTEFLNHGKYSHYKWPLVVLVNAGSASASEIVAGAVKDWSRGLILGTRTFGKGSVQTVIPLSDGSGLRLTTSKYYTPADISIQSTGIEPTITVQLEAKNGETPHSVVREKDLKRHLTNEKEQKENNATEKEIMPFQVEEKDDIQLRRAVDILKSWSIFKGLKTSTE